MREKIEKLAKLHDISIERINVWTQSIWLYNKNHANTDKFIADLRTKVFITCISEYFEQNRPKHYPNSVSITYKEID